MRYLEMEENLLNAVPELRPKIVLIKEQLGDIKVPTYVLYEEALNVYLHQLLIENSNIKKIKDIFYFYEKMAMCEDEEVRNLLQAALLEYLWTSRDIRDTAVLYMLPTTRMLLKEVEENFY